MYQITIKNLETGEVIDKTSKFITAQIRGDGGIFTYCNGGASSREVFEHCLALDMFRDKLLEKDEKAKMMYVLKDVIPLEKYTVDLDLLEKLQDGQAM